jgi:alkanesulfonate monooxygenase SsuD/methylene tetrahydromethanopterin reductase-like flavin-dependent oxidoreductase (luciferase family)
VQVLRALWAEPHVTFTGQWHTIDDAGINPLPTRRTIPLWFGGHEDVTLRRIAKWGDGWIMLAHPAGPVANAEFAKLRGYVKDAGRDPSAVGLEVWVSTAKAAPTTGASSSWPGRTQASRTSPSTALSPGSAQAHRGHEHERPLAAMTQYHAAVRDLI